MLRAEVQALADMGLNQMSLELIHPLVWGMVCYFCTDVPGSNAIISLVTFTHTLKHTFIHTHTCLCATLQGAQCC